MLRRGSSLRSFAAAASFRVGWAKGNDHMEGPNPAEWVGNLEYMMLPPPKKTVHRPSVAIEDAPRFMDDLHKRDGTGSRALEFLVLTAARSAEVRGTMWDELDLSEGMWVIPSERMKMGREHRVPLSLEAIALLKTMPRETALVFPAQRGGELSDMTLSATMKRMKSFVDRVSGKPAVPHGWRSTFRSWAAERGYDYDLAETALAHQVGSEVQAALEATQHDCKTN